MKKKSKSGCGATCPACGTHYRHASMALRCMRTPRCAWFNQPGGKRLDGWLRHALIFDLCTRLADSLVTEKDSSPEEQALGHALGAPARDTMICLFDAYMISSHAAMRYKMDNIETARAIYPDGTSAIVPFVKALLLLLEDVEEELSKDWDALPGLKAMPEHVKAVRSAVEAIASFYAERDAACHPGPNQPDMWTVYDTFHAAIFGTDQEQPAPSVYLVNGQLWCVSHGRKELREWLRTTFGFTRPTIEGVAPGEILEDGHPAS